MTVKTTRTVYWIVTIIFALFMIMDGIGGLMKVQAGKDSIAHLGYPEYFLTILGTGKLLGAIAVLQSKFVTIKEWAYAGFTINFLSASASHAYSGDSFFMIIMPWIVMAVMFISYFLWKKIYRLRMV